MQRRTNLFYTNGDDSNFITFSNYTEALTGNFLATDWKMFPTGFICMYIPNLNLESKKNFIQHISAYYENKLAFIRDYCITKNLDIRKSTKPLSWLLESIYNYADDSTNSSSSELEEEKPIITYIGNITEHNYNGVYADTICTIDSSASLEKYNLVENKNFNYEKLYYGIIKEENLQVIKIPYSHDYLYGWYKNDIYCGIEEYKDVNPIPDYKETINYDNDEEWYYYTDSKYSYIEKIPSNDINIKFNIIIPVFDLININTHTNYNLINDNKIDLITQLDNENVLNIPFGIWFANDTIELKRDLATGYAPSWSLVLSSQFKPLPYSDKLQNEGESYSSLAFETFASVLSRQNKILDSFNNLSINIDNINNRLNILESKINNIGSISSIDGLHKEFILFKNEINNIIDVNNTDIKDDIKNLQEQIDNLVLKVNKLNA